MKMKWSQEETELLLSLKDKPVCEIVEYLPGRTRKGVKCKLWQLGVRPIRMYAGRASRSNLPWSEAEVEIIRQHPGMSSEKLSELIEGRTEGAIGNYIRRNGSTHKKKKSMSDSQVKAIDKALENGWDFVKIAKKVGMPPSTLRYRYLKAKEIENGTD